MEHALYHPQFGYYATAAQRSGREHDFFTSVDVGSAFGELVELQLAEMADLLQGPVDLVEAGAGNGRLAADILGAMGRRHPALLSRLRLHLVESSAPARAAQADVLADVRSAVATSGDALPQSFSGILIANELLDAMPVHQVVMRADGLREVFVDVTSSVSSGGVTNTASLFTTREGPPSTPALADYLRMANVTLEPGWRAEINLNAVDWIRQAASRLVRGFIILFDYGHEARDLYSASHSAGTLMTFARHTAAGPESSPAALSWLQRPGEQDITAHVDFTSVRRAGEEAGLTTLGLLDQTYFLLGLLDARALESPESSVDQLKRRLAVKTLLLPGGLGSTMKVLVFGKGVGTPALRGLSYRLRMT